MNRKDHKEVFSEAYYDAVEDGCSPEEAEKRAEAAVIDHEESLMNEADNMRKELGHESR